MTTVSVLLPVYNAAHDLPRALDSLRQQTYTDFEVIAVNDGSTDSSGELLEAYAAHDKRIRVLHQANTGLGPAVNRACQVATGIYLARQDADDMSTPTRLAHQVHYMEQHPHVGLCGAWTWFVDPEIGPQFSLEVPDDHQILLRLLEKAQNPFVHGSVMVRKAIYERDGIGYRGALAEEFDLWLRLSTYSKLGMCQSVEYYYWLSPSGVNYGNVMKQLHMARFFLKLHLERKKFGQEKSDWLKEFTAISTMKTNATDPSERRTVADYTRGIHYLRLGDWKNYRATMQLAAAGRGPFATKARHHLQIAWFAPIVRMGYRYRERKGIMYYARSLPLGTSLPEYA